MALYDGFFDFDQEVLESTGKYDREYNAADFTTYLAAALGSAVYVGESADSMKVTLENGEALVAPGYLFLQGHWLSNRPGPEEPPETYRGYFVPLPSTGSYAVAAHLNASRKIIELVALPQAESYPNSLILALVDVAAGTVTDTRSDPALCGVIDSVGDTAAKAAYAVNYIDNEIEGRLEEAEAEIAAKSAEMDAKIAEVADQVDKLAPPPIGTVKFTASQNVDDTWLPCDGSFINQADYPELVAALGKHSPGVEAFHEVMGTTGATYMSNTCIAYNSVWVYLLDNNKLVGFTAEGKKEITVTGADSLRTLPNVDTVLSICNGALYLAQWGNTAAEPILLECVDFSGDEDFIEMTALSLVSDLTDKKYLECFVPSVTGIHGKNYMGIGISRDSTTSVLVYISWVPGDFSNRTTSNVDWELTFYSNGSAYLSSMSINVLRTYLAFSAKNDNELFFANGGSDTYTSSTQNQVDVYFSACSIVKNIFGATGEKDTRYTESYNKYNDMLKDRYYIYANAAHPLSIIPIAGNNEYLLGVEIENHSLKVVSGTYNPKSVFDWKTIDTINLPSRARIFKESACFAELQGLFFVFVGTGLAFTKSVVNGAWGYLDTQDVLGAISVFGCLNYDLPTNTLWISGLDSQGIPKVGKLKLPEFYDYANDGAWLPQIASDGVPAYIKAKETEAV